MRQAPRLYAHAPSSATEDDSCIAPKVRNACGLSFATFEFQQVVLPGGGERYPFVQLRIKPL